MTDSDRWLEEYGLNRDAGLEPAVAARGATVALRGGERSHSPRLSGSPPPYVPRGGELAHTGEKIARLADYDDTTETAPFDRPGLAEERAFFAQAEAEFSEDCAAETGVSVQPEKAAKRRRERVELAQQSHLIAMRLREGGFEAFRPDNCKFWRYYIHSRHWEAIPQYRRTCFLPVVAAAVRAPKLAALEYFGERNPFARFWTFTTGNRVGIGQLIARIRYLHRKLNRLNRQLRKRFGVEIVFRSTELGTVEFDRNGNRLAEGKIGAIEFGENGEPLFHVHAHCVVNSLVGYIRPARWQAMIQFVWNFWGHHWDAGECIKDARECCKYVTKPGDMLKLTPAQLAGVARALGDLHLVQTMGTLRREIAARTAGKKVLRRVRTPEGCVWRERCDHNKHADADKAGQDATFVRLLAERRLDEYSRAKPDRRDAKAVPFCRVAARLAPSLGPCGLKEPTVFVYGTHRDAEAIENHELVQKLWAETVEHWEAGRALASIISVHTDTSTGQGAEARTFDFYADCMTHPPWDAEKAVFETLEPCQN
jgi:hypothetical protein